MKILLPLLVFCMMSQMSIREKQDLSICGVSLADELSKVSICNDRVGVVDISGFIITISKRPLHIYTYQIPDSTYIEGGGMEEIEVPFLDFPFKKNGKMKFKRYYLFDRNGIMLSEFHIPKHGG